MRHFIYLSTAVLALLVQSAYSQEVIPPGITPNGTVSDLERKGNVMYVGGFFSDVGYQTGGMAYLPEHGEIPDLDFPYVNGEVYSVISDGNGGWFIGGEFSRVGQMDKSNVAHITSDFQVDPDFTTDLNNTVNALALKDDILYVGGVFSFVEGTDKSYLVAYDANTGELTDFEPDCKGIVYDLEIYENSLLVGGLYSSIKGADQQGLARIDLGTGDLEPFPPVSFAGIVYDLLVDGDSLYVGGTFTGCLMGVNLVNNLSLGWSPNVTGGIFNTQRVKAIDKKDSVIYFGGSFSGVDGEERTSLAAVSLSGNLLPFDPQPNGEIVGIKIHDDALYVGGEFDEIGGEERKFCAKIDLETGSPSDWNLGLSWEAHDMFLVNDDLLLGGQFRVLHQIKRDNAYAFNISTGEILDWNPTSNFSLITDLYIDQLRDAIYLTGYGKTFADNLVVVNGDDGDTIPGWSHVFNGYINGVDQDLVTGNMYFGGQFTEVGGQPHPYLVAAELSGELIPIDAEIDNYVQEVAVASDFNTVFFSGNFQNVDSQPRTKIAAINLDGELLDWVPKLYYDILNFDLQVWNIEPKGDTIFISGRFRTVNDVDRSNIAALDPINGTLFDWNPDVTANSISIMRPDDHGVLIGSPNMTAVDNFPVHALAYIDMESQLPLYTLPPDPGFYEIQTVLPYDSLLWIGGHFSFLNEKAHAGIAAVPYDFALGAPTRNVSRIYPDAGGNTGDVTIDITGVGFLEGSSVRLVGDSFDPIEANRDFTFIYDETRISATFDLRDAPVGFRDLELTIPGDTSLILHNAFQIVPGTEAQPWAEVIVPDFVTTNRTTTFYLSYGNKGNINADGVPVWVAFSPNIEVESHGFEIVRIMEPDNPYYDSIPEYTPIETLLGEPYEANVYSFIIPRIEANSSKMVRFKVKGANDGKFYTRAWASEPMYGSPLKYAVGECMDTYIEKVVGFLPYGGCAYGVIDLATSPVFDYIYDPDFNDSYAQNYLETAAWTGLECATDFISAGVGGFALDITKEILAAKDVYDVVDKCLTPEDKDDKEGEFINSSDPNDKSGLQGRGEGNWLNASQRFPFLIRFENEPEATAPAKKVVIKDTLDLTAFDLSSLELKGFGIADSFYTIPPGYAEYSMTVDLQPRLPYLVQTDIELDEASGVLSWTFVTLDPITKEEITDPLLGFLPPNTDTLSGQGSIFFDLGINPGLPPGTTIHNRAANIFDFNAPIFTNTWSINLDEIAPESAVDELPESTQEEEITVSWEGSDQGSGIRHYDVLYRKDEGEWQYLVLNTKETTAQLEVEYESTYDFYSVAHDEAFNIEAPPSQPDASIRVNKITDLEKDLGALRFSVFPNPVSQYLFFKAEKSIPETEFSLLTLTGKEIQRWKWVGIKEAQRSVSLIPAGLYLLTWRNRNTQGSTKIMVSK